jgi:hypothetical protein
MQKWFFIGLLILGFGISAQAQESTPTHEKLGEALTEALKTTDEYKIRDYYLNFEEYVAMMTAVSKLAGIPPNADKGEFSFLKARFSMNIDEVITVGKKRGINWSKIRFSEIKYGDSEMLDSLELVDMELYFFHGDSLYGMQLRSCVKVSGNWKIGERINWKYNKMTHKKAVKIDGSASTDSTLTPDFSDASTEALLDEVLAALKANDRARLEATYMDSLNMVEFINISFTGLESAQSKPNYSVFYKRLLSHRKQSLDQLELKAKEEKIEWSKIKLVNIDSNRKKLDKGGEILQTLFKFSAAGKNYLLALESIKFGDQWKLGELLWKGEVK